MRCILSLVCVLAGVAVAAGQSGQGIQWRTDVGPAIAEAQSSGLPMMFWVLGRNEDRDNNLENEQKRAFQDARVLRWSKRFITVRLSRSVNKAELEQLGISTSATLEVVFSTPQGEQLGSIGGSGAAKAESLAQKMKLVFNSYRQKMYRDQLQPILQKPDAKPDELRDALERVRNFRIDAASDDIVTLAEKAELDRKLLPLAYETLAELATKDGIEKLATLAAEGKPHAADALKKTTPKGAELLLPSLVKEGEVRVEIYAAIVAACDIKDRKSDKWWGKADEKLKKKELDRVTAAAEKAIADWKADEDE